MLILPHRLAREEAYGRNVVMLSDTGCGSDDIDLVKMRAKKCLHLEFDDICAPIEPYKACTGHDIQAIIDFASENEVTLVACYAGISRSSAVAYLIRCLTMEPQEAIKVLDKEKHHPNSRIVKIAAKLLGKPEMVDVCKELMWTYPK